jgi:hypothetical protein
MNQNSIEIYVRSSPLGPVGIHWRNISKNGQPMEEPEVLKSRIITKDNGKQATINSLINDTKPSVVLARYEDKILLEVTGLEASKERSSQLGRRITEVVLWAGDASTEVESQLRKLAACAMLSISNKDSTFLKIIRDAIRFEDLNAFQVDQVAIKRLTAEPDVYLEIFSQAVSDQSNPAVWSSPELITSDERLRSLAHQISQVPLPKTEQPVVIVSDLKNERLDYRGDIWKAPIQLQPVEVPVVLPEKADSESKKKAPPTQPKTLSFSTTRLILGVASAVVALIIILISLQLEPPVETTPGLTAPSKPTPTASAPSKPTAPAATPKTTPPKPTSDAKTTTKVIPSPKATSLEKRFKEDDLESPKISQD